MEVDFKVSLWTRATIREEDKDKVLAALRDGSISSFADLYELTEDPQWENLYDTMEDVPLGSGDGGATIEAQEAGDSEFHQTTVYTNKNK